MNRDRKSNEQNDVSLRPEVDNIRLLETRIISYAGPEAFQFLDNVDVVG